MHESTELALQEPIAEEMNNKKNIRILNDSIINCVQLNASVGRDRARDIQKKIRCVRCQRQSNATENEVDETMAKTNRRRHNKNETMITSFLTNERIFYVRQLYNCSLAAANIKEEKRNYIFGRFYFISFGRVSFAFYRIKKAKRRRNENKTFI